jgi:hypothetical protein
VPPRARARSVDATTRRTSPRKDAVAASEISAEVGFLIDRGFGKIDEAPKTAAVNRPPETDRLKPKPREQNVNERQLIVVIVDDRTIADPPFRARLARRRRARW